jgi:hypothetical protein
MLRYNDLTQRIIKCCYHVHNRLGHAFMGKVYENARAIELKNAGLESQCQYRVDVFSKASNTGSCYADRQAEQKDDCGMESSRLLNARARSTVIELPESHQP